VERLEGERDSENRLESDSGDVRLLPHPKADDEEAPAALSTSVLTLLLKLPQGEGDDKAIVIMAAVNAVCLLELRNGGGIRTDLASAIANRKLSPKTSNDEDAITQEWMIQHYRRAFSSH